MAAGERLGPRRLKPAAPGALSSFEKTQNVIRDLGQALGRRPGLGRQEVEILQLKREVFAGRLLKIEQRALQHKPHPRFEHPGQV